VPVSASTLRLLMAAGLGGDALLAVVESIEADAVRPKSSGAERQARYRARRAASVTSDVTRNVTESDATPPNKESSPTPPKEINPPPSSLRSVSRSAREDDDVEFEFSENFWPLYPHKVGKPTALIAFRKARRCAELAAILAGLQRYIREKPPDRSWLNPATFLNQQRWADEPATSQQPDVPRPRQSNAESNVAALGRVLERRLAMGERETGDPSQPSLDDGSGEMGHGPPGSTQRLAHGWRA